MTCLASGGASTDEKRHGPGVDSGPSGGTLPLGLLLVVVVLLVVGACWGLPTSHDPMGCRRCLLLVYQIQGSDGGAEAFPIGERPIPPAALVDPAVPRARPGFEAVGRSRWRWRFGRLKSAIIWESHGENQ